MFPESSEEDSVISENSIKQVSGDLVLLGFTNAQVKKAVAFLAQPSQLTSNLLNSLTPLEACIEYLVLHLPEVDLPARFLPSANSSNPFLVSSHTGADDLKKRWIEEKAGKEAGFPALVVKQCTTDRRLLDRWDLLIAALGQKLIGNDWEQFFDGTKETLFSIGDEDEISALGAEYVTPEQLDMPLFSAPIKLHILVSPNESYPETGYPPFYITSSSIPSYIRLHLLAQLLRSVQLEGSDFVQPGEGGFCMAAMRVLEAEWAIIEDEGPPDISLVLQHLVPAPVQEDVVEQKSVKKGQKNQRKGNGGRRDPRSNEQVKEEFDSLCKTDAYIGMAKARERLPAFKAKQDFLQKLEQHRCVVVVGETGCGKTTQCK